MFSALKFTKTLLQKQVTDVSLILMDSDMESENLSSLIRLSVSDSQKTNSSKDVSFYRYIINSMITDMSDPENSIMGRGGPDRFVFF